MHNNRNGIIRPFCLFLKYQMVQSSHLTQVRIVIIISNIGRVFVNKLPFGVLVVK